MVHFLGDAFLTIHLNSIYARTQESPFPSVFYKNLITQHYRKQGEVQGVEDNGKLKGIPPYVLPLAFPVTLRIR